jgi:hypothetical protein
MDQFAGISLKTRLYLLVLVAFIPVAILVVYVAEEQKAIEKNAILHKTKLLAQTAADAESLHVESTRNLMAAIAEISQLIYRQPERMSGLLSSLLNQTKGYAALGILDPTGRLVAGSDPSQMKNNYNDQEWLTAALEQGNLIMGRYHDERINGAPVLYFAHRIFDSSHEIMAVGMAAIDLNWMNRSIFRQLAEMPRGSRLTLADENQAFLQYEVDTARWMVPRPLDSRLQSEIVGRSSGILIGDDESGMSRIYAFANLESAFRQRRVALVMDIPGAIALAASKRIFVRNLIL